MKLKPNIAVLLRLFSRAEPIAGLEIADDALRLALLTFDKKKAAQEIVLLVENSLAANTISQGVIVEEPALIKSLQQLLKKTSVKVTYVILSLSIGKVYTRLFAFPPNTPQQKLEASMKLITEYQMPFKIDEVYLDWEKLETKDKNEFLLSAVPKPMVNQYANALSKAGLQMVALEIHPFSLLRTMNLPEEGSFLIRAKSLGATYVYVVKNTTLRYAKTLPISFIPAKEVENEIKRIKNFYEAENEPIKEVLDITAGSIVETYKHAELQGPQGNRWSISLGATVRGLLPRSQDKLISLMPIGTEKAYEYQRATSFSQFLLILTFWLSTFFSLAYIGAWLLMFSVQQRTAGQIELSSAQTLPAESATLEARAQKLNSITQAMSQITKTLPHWSILVEELRSRVGNGVVITSFSIAGLDSPITLLGVAQTRADLSLFKKSLEQSPLLKEVMVPLTNLEQKEKIPFTITVKIKEPQTLY